MSLSKYYKHKTSFGSAVPSSGQAKLNCDLNLYNFAKAQLQAWFVSITACTFIFVASSDM
jgi:hypothetical protein